MAPSLCDVCFASILYVFKLYIIYFYGDAVGLLSKEERLRILRTIEADDEFRHALMGALGYSELLDRLDKFEERQEKILEEIKKIWEEIRDLRKGQEKIWETLREVKQIQERLSLTLEEEANEVVTYLLERRGIRVATSRAVFDKEYEFDIYGVGEGFTIVGETKMRGSAVQIERFVERVKEATNRWPDRFKGRLIKVFYCMSATLGTEDAAKRLGVWLIVSNREATELIVNDNTRHSVDKNVVYS